MIISNRLSFSNRKTSYGINIDVSDEFSAYDLIRELCKENEIDENNIDNYDLEGAIEIIEDYAASIIRDDDNEEKIISVWLD